MFPFMHLPFDSCRVNRIRSAVQRDSVDRGLPGFFVFRVLIMCLDVCLHLTNYLNLNNWRNLHVRHLAHRRLCYDESSFRNVLPLMMLTILDRCPIAFSSRKHRLDSLRCHPVNPRRFACIAYPRVRRDSKFLMVLMVQFFIVVSRLSLMDTRLSFLNPLRAGLSWPNARWRFLPGDPWSRSLLRFRLVRSPESFPSFGNRIGCGIQLHLKAPRVSGRTSCMNWMPLTFRLGKFRLRLLIRWFGKQLSRRWGKERQKGHVDGGMKSSSSYQLEPLNMLRSSLGSGRLDLQAVWRTLTGEVSKSTIHGWCTSDHNPSLLVSGCERMESETTHGPWQYLMEYRVGVSATCLWLKLLQLNKQFHPECSCVGPHRFSKGIQFDPSLSSGNLLEPTRLTLGYLAILVEVTWCDVSIANHCRCHGGTDLINDGSPWGWCLVRPCHDRS